MDPSQVLRQTEVNVSFLIRQNHISAEDGKDLLDKLAACHQSLHALSRPAKDSLPSLTSGSSKQSSSSSGSSSCNSGSPPDKLLEYRRPPTPPLPILRVRAKWDWNHVNPNPNDLSFFKGDIFQLLEETNDNWYTGKHFGSDQQGTFPANYVEKLPSLLDDREPARPPLPATTQQMCELPMHDGYSQSTGDGPNYLSLDYYNDHRMDMSNTYSQHLSQERLQQSDIQYGQELHHRSRELCGAPTPSARHPYSYQADTYGSLPVSSGHSLSVAPPLVGYPSTTTEIIDEPESPTHPI